jgi:N-acetylmuramoyl-L-alanine amidase
VEARGDLLVSIHLHGGPAGVRAYVGDAERWGEGADPERLDLGLGGTERAPGDPAAAGRLLGRFLVGSAAAGLSIRDGGVWPAALSELVRAGMPAVLVEISLGASAWDDAALDAAAASLAEGLRRYLRAGGAGE